MQFTRFAIYVTPAPGTFADLGAAWLGWDSTTGQPVRPPPLPDLPAPAHEITATPRRYGLHATIVPPFHLAGAQTAQTLLDGVIRVCDATRPVTLDGLEIAAMGRFLALVPSGDTGAADALAADTLRALDRFRAPLGETELARRRKPTLTPQQDANLTRWGYPHVMSEFRFHITLTGKRPGSELAMLKQVLDRHLLPVVPRPFPVEALSLMGEDAQGRFHLIRRQPLGG